MALCYFYKNFKQFRSNPKGNLILKYSAQYDGSQSIFFARILSKIENFRLYTSNTNFSKLKFTTWRHVLRRNRLFLLLHRRSITYSFLNYVTLHRKHFTVILMRIALDRQTTACRTRGEISDRRLLSIYRPRSDDIQQRLAYVPAE